MTGILKSVLLVAALAAVAGCGDDEEGKKPKKPDAGGAAAPAGGAKYDASKSTGGVKVVVKWSGEKPEPQKVPITEPTCQTPAGVMAERFAINADGTLPNAFVWVSSADGPLKGMSGYPDSPPVVLDQRGCIYTPHIFGVRVGQTLTVKNSDGIKHNVHARPSKNKEINQSQDKDTKNDFVFEKTEKAIPFNCDVHSWMNATAFVLDHPFFATTGADGSVTIKGLPAGDYTLMVWHERFKGDKDYEAKMTVSVKDGATTDAAAELK